MQLLAMVSGERSTERSEHLRSASEATGYVGRSINEREDALALCFLHSLSLVQKQPAQAMIRQGRDSGSLAKESEFPRTLLVPVPVPLSRELQ